MPGKFLGEFELYLMLAAAGLGDADASGSAIRRTVERRTGRDVAIGAMYTTLSRLADKGLIQFRIVAPSDPGGGRPAKHYSLTATGREAMRHSSNAFRKMTEDLGLIDSQADLT